MWQPKQYSLAPGQSIPARIVVGAFPGQQPKTTLICNQDPNNTVYLGTEGFGIYQTGIASIPPGGNVIVSGQDDVYALAPDGAAIQVVPNAVTYQLGSSL